MDIQVVDAGEDSQDVGKARALFQYLYEFSKLRQANVLNINNYQKKFLRELPDDPKNIEINFRDTTADGDGNFGPILKITRPDFLECPQPPAVLDGWLWNGWRDYTKSVCVIDRRYVDTLQPVREGQPIREGCEIEEFESSEERISQLEDWEALRDVWIEKQRHIARVRGNFSLFYNFHTDLRRDSAILELDIANGFLAVKGRPEISHPLLIKRISIEFNARSNTIVFDDEDTQTELFTEMLDGVEGVDLTEVTKFRRMLQEKNYHPLDRNSAPDFLKMFLHSISPASRYIGDVRPTGWTGDDKLVCYWDPVIIIRHRRDGAAQLIEKIISDIDSKHIIPSHIGEIVSPGKVDVPPEPEETFEARLAAVGGECDTVLLSKEANREQLEIAKRIERYNAVVVQGPPGTGKTHTIANLLGHFLSQGKSVLVTSYTQKALSVLKDKLPEVLQPLCVSVMDDSKHDMVRAIDGITEYLSHATADRLRREGEALRNERVSLMSQLAEHRKKLFAVRHQECSSLAFNGESFSPTQAAQFVADGELELSYIPGDVKKGSALPLSVRELTELYRTNVELTREEEHEFGCSLPDVADVPTVDEYETLVASIREGSARLQEMNDPSCRETISSSPDGRHVVVPTPRGSIEVSNCQEAGISKIEELIHEMSIGTVEPWMKRVVVDGKLGGDAKRRWEILEHKIDELCSLSSKVSLLCFGHEVTIPDDAGESLNADFREMKQILDAGGSIGSFKLLLHPSWKTSLGAVSVDGEKPLTKEFAEIICGLLELKTQRVACGRYWDQLMTDAGACRFADLDVKEPERVAKNFQNDIRSLLDWYNGKYLDLCSSLREIGVVESSVFQFDNADSDIVRTDKIITRAFEDLPKVINACRAVLLVRGAEARLDECRAMLLRGERARSIICQQLAERISKKDCQQYAETYGAYNEVLSKAGLLNRRRKLIAEIEDVAPGWAQAIRAREGVHGLGVCPDRIQDAWRWKQYGKIIAELIEQPYEKLQHEGVRLSVRYRELTAELASVAAWYHLLHKTEGDHSLQANLKAWSQTMLKIGKGHGILTAMLRQKARELMSKCQLAVPVWVMPIAKVMETLDPAKNKFDIVIVDEASQADITALAVTYMARKVIVVGDDRQVSPVSVGINTTRVSGLIQQYLSGVVDNEWLYDQKTSLYDVASMTYQPLMLREHFRCMPNIIGFSNMLSYDFGIKPLRDPGASALLPSVVPYRVDGMRTDDVNQTEAKTIVALMQACIEQPEYQKMTFGVISLLGEEQGEIIQKIVNERLPLCEIEDRQILCGNPPSFQGDERDVVFLSLVDSGSGRGPLSLQTGEGNMAMLQKRYNVAASRARDQMWVVHSLDVANDLKDGDIRKRLIDYAVDPTSAKMRVEEAQSHTESPFESEVAAAIIARGFKIIPQWKVGAYRIDFVVCSGKKKVALECDGERYHGADRIRDDMERQHILERMGWRFIRLRGSEYYRNKSKAVDRVVADLEKMGIAPCYQGNGQAEVDSSDLLERVKTRASKILEEWNATDAEKGTACDDSDVCETGALQRERSRRRSRRMGEQLSLFDLV